MDSVEEFVRLHDRIAQLEERAVMMRQHLVPERLGAHDPVAGGDTGAGPAVDRQMVDSGPPFLRPTPLPQIDLLRYRC